VETAKRLIIGGFLLLIFVLLSPAAARANGVSTWTNSWCGPSSTWSGLVGLNNDYPGPATVTGLTVSNGLTLSNITVGKVIGSFEQGNLEGTATGLPISLASFTVTITLAVPGGGSVSRTMAVSRPADCGGVVATTPTTPATTASTTTTTSTTTAPSPGATNVSNPTTTPTSAPQPIAPVQPIAPIAPIASIQPIAPIQPITVPLKPSVLGSTVIPSPAAITALPKTGGQSTRAMSAAAAVTIALGVSLLAVARMGRPAKP
jgi:LPXTG-motif cell wall-anchored protein